MSDSDAWLLYSTESEPTHIPRPETTRTYCGDSLDAFRAQGRANDPSAFHAQDHFCTECVYEYLGESAVALADELTDE